jgi:shikimate kinase
MTHVVLVGMMGTGKTTVGRILAERLCRPFSDSDEHVASRTGRTVREISHAEGEAAYRAHETRALLDALASTEPSVIAAAGGVVLDAANRGAIRSSGARVVWLKADPALLVDRVTSSGHRPLLDDDPAGTLQGTFRDREHLYREVADSIVDVDGRDVTEVVEAVVAAIAETQP